MSAHIPPCDVDTNGGDCSCANTWMMRVAELEQAIREALVFCHDVEHEAISDVLRSTMRAAKQ